MIKYLSYKLSAQIPVYGSIKKNMRVRQVKSIENGDSCQVYWIGMENHWGTHIDCPAHFFVNGARIIDYEADFWLFRKPQVLSIKVQPAQILSYKDLTAQINPEADLLLLRSGWRRLRGDEVYSLRNPGINPELGVWLRRERPLLRAIGFDWVSISSYQHRELGREAHRAFLNPEGEGHPILLIEDMDIPENTKNLKEVWVAPLRVEGVDSVPCTVAGIFE